MPPAVALFIAYASGRYILRENHEVGRMSPPSPASALCAHLSRMRCVPPPVASPLQARL